MRLATRISVIKDVQSRSAKAVFWRRQSGGAAANEEKSVARECVSQGNEELAFELENKVPVSLDAEAATQASLSRSYFKTWEAHKRAADSGDTGTSIPRVWQSAHLTSHASPQEKFVITSFNILASEHALKHRMLYPSVPLFFLRWGRRRQKILQELEFCSPDIICLQEVDKFADLEEDLASRGYVGLYKGRTGEMPDGCAIFWRKTRFQLLQERSFEFSMLDMRNNVAQLCVLQSIMPEVASGPTVSRIDGQIQSHHLVVGNIHVLYNPKRGDIKLGQCRAFLEQVHNMSSIWHGAPVVIGGDFNSTPSSAVYKYIATSELELTNLDRTRLSGLLPKELETNEKKLGKGLLASRKVLVEDSTDDRNLREKEVVDDSGISDMVLSLKETCYDDSTVALVSNMEFTETIIAGSSCYSELTTSTEEFVEGNKHGWEMEELRIATGKENCTLVRHELNLHSAYSDIQGRCNTRDAKGEPLLTTCHKGFLGTVDYIWRNDGLKTMKVLDTPPVMSLATKKDLPIKVWGSDHLPLACELAFTQDSKHIAKRNISQACASNV